MKTYQRVGNPFNNQIILWSHYSYSILLFVQSINVLVYAHQMIAMIFIFYLSRYIALSTYDTS
jgi:hypothetical protein